MRKILIKRISKKYIVLITVSILLTPSAVEAAYQARQAFHFGGEWLLIPLAVLMGLVADTFKEIINKVKEYEKQ